MREYEVENMLLRIEKPQVISHLKQGFPLAFCYKLGVVSRAFNQKYAANNRLPEHP